MNDDTTPSRGSLRELALVFLKLGTTAFGGPAVHIAMMRDEVVHRRGWIDDGRFLDLVGATNLIPGPNSTELAIHIGWDRARWRGLLVAGGTFILPAMLITSALGWAYVRFGALPEVRGVLYGVEPVVIAVVLQAIVNLARRAAQTTRLRLIGLVSILAVVVGVDELATLAIAGVLAVATRPDRSGRLGASALQVVPLAALPAASVVASPFTLAKLFGVFLKIGAVLFGSGYVLLAFLRADLVERLGWLTEAQLVDAIAVGQVTPGPVFTTATFIGYVLAGPAGAVVATVGIFLPAFFFVALSGPLVPKLRASPVARALLDGVNVASLALMAVVTTQLGRAAIVDLPTVALALGSAVALLGFGLRSTWLVPAGAVIGVVLQRAGVGP